MTEKLRNVSYIPVNNNKGTKDNKLKVKFSLKINHFVIVFTYIVVVNY